MQVLLILLVLLIIVFNLIVNLTNITIIIKYCLGSNSLSEYWSLYFKNCFSFRAIYSSIFGLVLALILFVILIPIIIIRKILFKSKVQQLVSDGLIFYYKDVELPLNTTFFSNCNDFGFAINKVTASGNIAEDVEQVLHSLITLAEANAFEIKYHIMKEMYIASKDKTAIAPLLIVKNEESFPVYFLYDDNQVNQFKNVRILLQETRFKQCIYFSVKNF